MLFLGQAEVEALIDLDELIDALAPAMAELSAGRASAPDRIAARVPEQEAFLAAMPGYVPSADVLMTKLVSLFPGNAGTPLPTHQAVIVVFDPATGEPTAFLDGTAITTARTAAGSALSARLLAREDAAVLAVLGTGVQAGAHARAMCRVRPVREIRIAGRDPAKAAVLAAALTTELSGARQDGSGSPAPYVEVRAVPTYAEALDGADLVAAATHSVEPVVRRHWLSPGAHIASVGFNPAGREIDDATIADALICVESRRAALAPFPAGSTDLLGPIRDGVVTADHLHAEVGELVTGSRTGRTSPDQITLYKSVGVAVQDAAAAALVVAAARKRSSGRRLPL